MRKPYAPEYYEGKLEAIYQSEYSILPTAEWHGLRTWVDIICTKHGTTRHVELKKVFNGEKSTWPCRRCYLASLSHPPTAHS